MIEAVPFDRLAPRDVEVLDLTSQGLRRTHIARAMGVSPSTVTNQITTMLLRLGLTGEKTPRVVSLACQAGHFKEPLDINEPIRPLKLPELLAVYCVAEGLTAQRDAEIRGIRSKDVGSQRDRAKQKVGASTLTNLVRRAYQLELLPLSAPWIQAQIEALPAKGHGSSQFDKLTNRQKEVLDLASKGLRGVQIAHALGVTLKAVENHTRVMYQRLGLTGKPMSKVVSLACQAGHFTDPLPIDRPAQDLTEPELLAVHYLAEGFTAQMDAETRGRSSCTINEQRAQAQRKVGALTLPHLVRCSYQLGFLPLDPHWVEAP